MSKWINKDFMINHYFSMLTDPTPDVSENDKRKARIVLDALKMTKGIDIVVCHKCKRYKGVHGTMGNAPCDFWNAMVMWNWFCIHGREVDDE